MRQRGLRLWHWLVGAALVLASGAGGAFYAFKTVNLNAHSRSAILNHGWRTDRTFAAASASPYTRAYLAVVGLLGLPRSEAIYFFRDKADGGETLESDAVYEITGRDMPGRWWSLTLYDADQFLTPNRYNRYSVRSSDLKREPDGSFRIRLSRDPQPGNWIPMGDGHNMSLLLRVYNPEPGLDARLDSIALPTLRKVEGQ